MENFKKELIDALKGILNKLEETETNIVDIGKGYYQLTGMDVVTKGDEYFDAKHKIWIRSSKVLGWTYDDNSNGLIYRRKLPTEQKVVKPEIPYGWVITDKPKVGYKYYYIPNKKYYFIDDDDIEFGADFSHITIIKPIEVPRGYELMPKGTDFKEGDMITHILIPNSAWIPWQCHSDKETWYIARPIKKFNRGW